MAEEQVGEVTEAPIHHSALALLGVDGVGQPAPQILRPGGDGEVEPGGEVAAAEGVKLELVDPGGELRHLVDVYKRQSTR